MICIEYRRQLPGCWHRSAIFICQKHATEAEMPQRSFAAGNRNEQETRVVCVSSKVTLMFGLLVQVKPYAVVQVLHMAGIYMARDGRRSIGAEIGKFLAKPDEWNEARKHHALQRRSA